MSKSPEHDDNDVLNIDEDSQEDYDIDKNVSQEYAKFQMKQQQQNAQKNRPESSKQKQISSGNKRKKSDKEQQEDHRSGSDYKNEMSPEEQQRNAQQQKILSDFQIFVKQNFINIETFWKSSSVFITVQEFREYLNDVCFNLNLDDQELFEDILKNEKGFIKIEDLCKNVEPWRNNADIMIDFIKEKALRIAKESKRKIGQFKIQSAKSGQSGNLRPASSSAYYSRPISGISFKSKQQSELSDIKGLSTLKTQQQVQNQNKSKEYLKKHKEKEMEIERLLALTINRGKNEYEYECLKKMGDANDISQKLGSQITYRAYKSADGNLKVHVYKLDNYKKELTLDEFLREYNIIKNQFKKQKHYKFWESMDDTSKPQKQQKIKYKHDDKEEDDYDQRNLTKQQKIQNELKQVLLKTMTLTNKLKDQLSILNKQGINSNINTENKHPFSLTKQPFKATSQAAQSNVNASQTGFM